jgi:hypothetical protein
MEIVLEKSHQKSFILLTQQLLTVGFGSFCYGLWVDSTIDAAVILSSAFATHSRVSLDSV